MLLVFLTKHFRSKNLKYVVMKPSNQQLPIYYVKKQLVVIVRCMYCIYSNVAAITVSEGHQGMETSTNSAGSHGKLQRLMNKEKGLSSRRSAARRSSQDIAKESIVLAGELFSDVQIHMLYLVLFSRLCNDVCYGSSSFSQNVTQFLKITFLMCSVFTFN